MRPEEQETGKVTDIPQKRRVQARTGSCSRDGEKGIHTEEFGRENCQGVAGIRMRKKV